MTDLSLTLSSTDLTVTAGSGASVTASVTNTGATRDRVVCGVYAPTGGTPPAAATVDRPLREIGPGATEQFVVTVGADAPSGTSAVRVIAYSADRAPEEFADTAQTVTVHHEVVVGAPAAAERPWWLLLVAALVLVVAVVAVVLVRSRPTPSVAVTPPTTTTTTTTAPACQPGFVPRLTRPSDSVCVSPASAAQVVFENTPAVQDQRKPTPRGGPYGPETCLVGWVWRDAYDGDTICVTGDTRARAAQENVDAPLHAGP